MLDGRVLLILFILRINRVGDIMLPWGTPSCWTLSYGGGGSS